MSPQHLHIAGILLLRSLHKRGLFLLCCLAMGRQGRKLRLDFADSLNEKLRLRFPFAALRNLFHNRDILEPCGIGFGEVQGKLRAAGTEQFIKNAG